MTSTVLLVQALQALGANVHPYIPHRVDEGYGLNSEALLKLARRGVKLVITVDCGIRSVQEVEDGKAVRAGHHHHRPSLGRRGNPRRLRRDQPEDGSTANYSEDMLAGVGVAYRLAEALFTIEAGSKRNGSSPSLNVDDLLDLVAIGTVADLAPMNRRENRALVRRGLEIDQPGAAPRLARADQRRRAEARQRSARATSASASGRASTPPGGWKAP